MNILFQCAGITGVILILYGLLAFAVTRGGSQWFFWSLIGTGAVLSALFVIKSLSRHWQRAVGAFVSLNLAWIFLLVGKERPMWQMGIAIGVCAAGLAISGFKRVPNGILGASLAVLIGSFAALFYFHEKPWFGYGVLGAAFLYNVIFFYISKLLLREVLKSRSLQYGSSAAIYTGIFLAIIVVANVLSSDRHHQWDFTEEKVSKLTDQSVKIIKGLKEPVKVTVYSDERNPEKPGLRDLLQSYRYESKNMEFRFVDPDKDKQTAVQHKVKDGDILIEYAGQNNITQDASEQGITQAILKVTKNSNPIVCFTKGHGEMEIDTPDDQPRSLSGIKGGLENEGYKAKVVDSIAADVPADCQVLIVAGPTQTFTKDEAGAVDRYLTRGGKGIFMLDPVVPDPRLFTKNLTVSDTGLEEVMAKWGVDLGKNFILEKHLELLRGVQIGLTVIAMAYGNHPIVEPLKDRQTVFQNVRSVKKKEGYTGTAIELISSAGQGASWAETEVENMFRKGVAKPDGKDLLGPVPIAVVSEKERPKVGEESSSPTRLVVFGDADFVSNGMVRSYEFNFDLFLNTLGWLQGEVEQISIRPKKLRSSAIELTPEQQSTIFYIAIIGIPMLVLIFGMDLWWWRRRRG